MEKHGDHIDVAGLSKALGVPVIPITARSGRTFRLCWRRPTGRCTWASPLNRMILYDGFTYLIHHHKVGELIHDKAYAAHIPAHWASIKLIEGTPWWRKPWPVSEERDELEAVCREYEGPMIWATEALIADARYPVHPDRGIVAQCVRRGRPLGAPTLSDRIDAIVTHKVLAIPVFLLMMLCMFALTFGPGQMLADGVDALIGGWFTGVSAPPGRRGYCTVGGGPAGGRRDRRCGRRVTFLPQIAILFLFLSSWRIQATWPGRPSLWTGCCGASGLSGKAFIPCSWAGCTVPAVMEPAPWRTRRTAA